MLVIFGSIYILFQQVLRFNANDPQIQMSTDLALNLANGVIDYPDSRKIDISKSLSPVTIVLDDKQRVLFNNASLDGKQPVPPKGVFDFAKTTSDNRITWQPKPGVRLALVVKYFDGRQKGYVAVARSLTEVENRSAALLRMTVVGLAIAIGTTFWFSIFKWG